MTDLYILFQLYHNNQLHIHNIAALQHHHGKYIVRLPVIKIQILKTAKAKATYTYKCNSLLISIKPDRILKILILQYNNRTLDNPHYQLHWIPNSPEHNCYMYSLIPLVDTHMIHCLGDIWCLNPHHSCYSYTLKPITDTLIFIKSTLLCVQ